MDICRKIYFRIEFFYLTLPSAEIYFRQISGQKRHSVCFFVESFKLSNTIGIRILLDFNLNLTSPVFLEQVLQLYDRGVEAMEFFCGALDSFKIPFFGGGIVKRHSNH